VKLTPITYVLPACWASYLINGDHSGLEPGEKQQVDAFLEREKLSAPSGCDDEAHFSRHNDAHTGLSEDVLGFTFLVVSEGKAC
jgi:hypothetical protein